MAAEQAAAQDSVRSGPRTHPSETAEPQLSWRGFWLGAAVTVVLVVSGCFVIFTPWVGPRATVLATDSLNLVAQVVGVVLCLLRYRLTPHGPLRLVWLLLSVNGTLWAVGNGFFLYYDAALASPPFPSVADVFYLAGVVPALVALGVFPAHERVRRAGWRFVLDVLVLASAVALLCYLMLLKDVFATAGDGPAAWVLSTYPVTDVLLVALLGVLLLRGAGRRLDLVLLAAGFLSFAVADVSYAYLAARGIYSSGGALDVGYLLGPLLIGLGALAPHSVTAPSRRGRAFSAVLPDLVVLAAIVAFAVHGSPDMPTWLLFGLTVVVTALRQVMISTDNHNLRAHLEKRVHERTEELGRLSLHHEQILDSVGEGIFGVDATGQISFMNPIAARLLGRRSDELVGQNIRSTFLAGTHAGRESMVESVMVTGEIQTRSDIEYARQDGTTFPVEVTAAPTRADGPVGAVVIFRDITERRAIDLMKSEFIAVVSHELRTPLTSMSMSLEMLADGGLGELPASAHDVVAIARRGTERLSRLVNDILDIERLESGASASARSAPPAQPTGPLMTSALHSIRPIADAAGVRLIVGEVEGWVHADADRVVQVLINLLGNAVKFTERGRRIWVSAQLVEEEVTFTVADEGRGIPQSQLENIFESFQRVVPQEGREVGGTGLGLTIARSIVQRHGGRLWVESEVGVGSTFTFTLPAASSSPETSTPAGWTPHLLAR